MNNLTPAQIERLTILIEECAEVQQAATKILRHGFESFDPTKSAPQETNEMALERELGDLNFAIDLMLKANDFGFSGIMEAREAKVKKIIQYLRIEENKRLTNTFLK